MKRIYPPHAYSEAPRAACYWPSTTQPPECPPARGEIKTDIAVIGAGFTGLSAALHLAEAGADVTVLDAQVPGWGASGRNGGFCCLGGAAASAGMMRRQYGETARREWSEAEVAAIDTARSIIERYELAPDIHSDGETLLAHNQRAFDGFDAYAEKAEQEYGVTPVITPAEELTQIGMKGPFFGAITIPLGFALNPFKYTSGMTKAAQKLGARIHGHSPVQRIDNQNGFTLTTPEARITARRLIVATNGYSSDDLPDWLRGRYLPTQSNVVVTRELTDEEISAQGWSSNQMCYDDRFLLHYFRLMPNNRMLFGMRGGFGSSPEWDEKMHRLIRQHFETMFPAWAHVETPFSWHGLLSISRDLTPYAGPIPEMPGAFTALSYHGNGVSMASHAGALLADLALDRAPARLYPKVMQRPPRRYLAGSLRRANLLPIRAWAMLTGG